jgi:uncharacterized protein YraI
MAKLPVLRTLAALLLALPLLGSAEQARTKQWVNVRAGPAGHYPSVTRLPPGTDVQVYGCIRGYRWCDVIASDGQRGWALGGSLYYPYEDRWVPVTGYYGPGFGIPITPFVMGDYWGSHYRQRPWYGHRQYWGPGHGRGAGDAPVYAPGYGPGYNHAPVYVPAPHVPRHGVVQGPGHVPRPPHAPGAGLPRPPAPPGLPRPPRPPRPPGRP